MIFNLPSSLKAKLAFALLLLAAFTAGLSSCKKKDSDSASLPLTGSWRAVDSSSIKYVIFNSGMATYLQQGLYNIHDLAKTAYVADAETVTFSSSGSPDLYNYKVSNDTLYITNTTSYLRYVKDNTVNPDTWVKYITTLQSNDLASGLWFGSTEWTGSDFLVASIYANKLYHASAVTSTITDSTALILNATGLAVTSNGETWINNYGGDSKLYKINPATAATLFTSSSAPSPPFVLAADGNLIWFFAADGLYTYNTATDVFTLKKAMTSFLSGSSSINPDMVIKDGYAYIAVYNYILKFNLTTYQVEDTFKNNDAVYNIGLTYDGSNFWLLGFSAGSSSSSIGVKLNKVQF